VGTTSIQDSYESVAGRETNSKRLWQQVQRPTIWHQILSAIHTKSTQESANSAKAAAVSPPGEYRRKSTSANVNESENETLILDPHLDSDQHQTWITCRGSPQSHAHCLPCLVDIINELSC